METETVKLKTVLSCFAALIVVELMVNTLVSKGGFNQIIMIGAARALEAGLIIGIVHVLECGLSVIGLDPNTLSRGLKRGVLWSAGFAIIALTLYAVLTVIGIQPLKFIKGSIPAEGLVSFLIVGIVIGPIAEELIFRGVVFGYVRQWGAFAAVVVSTVLFTMAHAATGGLGLTQIVGAIVFAVAYELEGNLMVPVTIHVLGNSAIFALSIV